MAFTVREHQDLTHLLAARPKWQAELRRLILSLVLSAAVSSASVSKGSRMAHRSETSRIGG